MVKGRPYALPAPSLPEDIVFLVAIPQAHVGVPAAAILLVIPLGHKAGEPDPVVTNFFDACFENVRV